MSPLAETALARAEIRMTVRLADGIVSLLTPGTEMAAWRPSRAQI
jgi:hypothetical protein